MAPGLFTWDDKHVRFSFYGAGKERTITLLRTELSVLIDREVVDFDEARILAPANSPWEGALTATPGVQHAGSKLWQKAAWNTINQWCLPMDLMRGQVPLLCIMELTEACYGRFTTSEASFYLMPPEEGDEPAGSRVFLVPAGNSIPTIPKKPAWYTLSDPRFIAYAQVAWDTYESSGRQTQAQLQGA
jgi:hypothetical protein